MRIILLLLISMMVLSPFSSVEAIPTISNIKIEPTNPWLNQDVSVSCVCNDEDYNINNVYINVIGPNITISNLHLTEQDGTYSYIIGHSYLYRTGQYNVNFYCVNNVSENATGSGMFTVSNLVSTINDINPSPAYIGDVIEIDVLVKKDNTNLDSGVSFNISLNDQNKNLKQDPPIYDSTKGWILKIDAPSDTGIFNLNVTVGYEGAEASSISTVEVKQPLEFDLVSIDKTWVKSNDNITLTFKAMFKGSAIDLRDEYLGFLINSVDSNIIDIYRSGEYSYVKLSAPNLVAGAYDFKIKFTYMGFVKEITREINYVVPISGSIIDSSNKPIPTQLKFRNNATDTTFTTSSSGSYSGDLPPGIYDIEITFPNSKLTLTQVTVNEFNNPIKYDIPPAQLVMSGVGTGGIFVYEIALTYSNAYLEMTYDDSKILDETRMILYKCENWNFGRKLCNADWKTINGQIDTVRNTVNINTTSLFTFLIGYKKDLFLNFNTDKDEYSLKEIIKVTGIVQDEDSKPVSDIQVTSSIINTGISSSTKTDDSGVFSLEFQGPDKEGDFTILVKAEKSPFTAVNKTKSIKLFRSEKITLLIPDSIKINQGENAPMWVSIVNTGQIDYSRLTLSLSGIPDGYYTIPTEIEQLKAGEEKKISVDFKIPYDASIVSHTGKLKINYGNNSLEQQFILSISIGEDNKTVNVSTDESFKFPSLFTGKLVLPTLGLDVMSIAVIATLVFLISVFLKRKKLKTVIERKEIKNTILDIKGEIERHPIKKIMKRNTKKFKKRKKIKKLKKKKSK